MAMEDMMYKLIAELKDTAKPETIVGAPIEAAGKTIIPVSKVTMGFGGGYGQEKEEKRGGGVGAGGGISVKPVALIVIDEEGVNVASLTKGFGFDKIVELVPELIEKLRGARQEAQEAEEG